MRTRFRLMVMTPRCFGDPALAIAGSRAGALGIVDLGALGDTQTASKALADLVRLGGTRVGFRVEVNADTKVLAELSSMVPDDTGVVVVAPDLGGEFGDALSGVVSLLKKKGLGVIAEVSSLEEAAAAALSEVDGLIAKGNEAGGRVEEETTFVLLQRLLERTDLPVWARGGIGMHTAAACAAAGAAGVVLADELALVRESTLPVDTRNAISAMDGSETTVLGAELGRSLRLFVRPGNQGFERLKRLHEEMLVASDREGWRTLLREAAGRPEGSIGWRSHQAWPLGQDACFAGSLAQRFHTTGGVVAGLLAVVDEHLGTARSEMPLAPDSALARSHGTRYPVVQGPMTRVSDVAPFAAAVAEAGGLPFIALALLRAREAEEILSETQKALGDRPWGVGILGFVPRELRDEQLEVVRRFGPKFALIAGGRPDQAHALEADGIASYLHVPSPRLLEIYLNQGAKRFVFEGRECGGHVGPRSSYVLWDQMVSLLLERSNGGGLGECHILFAGGIHDARSAAMVAALAAPIAAAGAKIGVLMGTAYLFTEEAVSTGAIVPGFQEVAVNCARTTLLETGPGHATRCAITPFSDRFLSEKARLRAEGRPDEEVRYELEALNLGKLRVAAKGVDHNPAHDDGDDTSKLLSVDAEQQAHEGMYMIGQVAAIVDRVVTMAELHERVSAGATEWLGETSIEHVAATKPAGPPLEVAIVGMSCLLPKAQSIRAYWSNILHKVDAVTEVPRDRWDWHDYYDPDRKTRDKVYSKWGGFLDDIVFNPLEYGMPPTSLSSIEPLQLLTLKVATAAMKDSGYLDRPFDRERASVILGAGGGVSDLGVAYSFRSSLPLLAGDSPAGLMASLPEWTEDSFPGILMNVAAGRIANRLDFGGINCTMDAACAASLAALYLAVQELESGASDLVITGGADTAQNPFMYLCFAKTQALSPSGRCRTFDQSADGIAISEGIAAVVLKRLADAERDGDRIYAVIKGVGGSSDGREKGLTAPRPAGQAKALRRAYAKAGFSPATVGLIEAHGTGTVAGDKAEVETLKTVFQEEGAALQTCALGSVKSMIGHTKCTAGVAGLIKIALALHHKVLPPTLHVTEPNREATFHESPFYVNTELRPWIQPSQSGPRRAGVSAFGFGGTNFHVVVEEYTEAIPGVDVQAVADDWPAELFLLRADSPSGLLEEIEICSAALASGTASSLADLSASVWRRARERRHAERSLAIVAISLDDLRAKLESSRSTVVGDADGEASSEIFFFDEPLAATGGLAFLYPGQGSQYPNMFSELTSYFVELRESFELADQVLEERFPQPLSRTIFPPIAFTPEDRKRQMAELTATRIAQPALGATEIGLTRLLERLGVSPEVTAGHSYGEYMALCAAGVFDAETLLRISELRGRVIEEEGERGLGTMAAVTADPARVGEVLGGMSDVWIANLNSPQQTVISGTEEAVTEAEALLQQAGLNVRRFNVACAFHSPLVAPAAERLAAGLAEEVEFKEPQCEVYSNTSAKPYPKTAAQIAEQLTQHLVSTVRFSDEITAMYDAGVRVFIEVGPKSVLSDLTRKILADRPVAVLAVDPFPDSGMKAFLQLIGALAAHGHGLDLDRLYEGRALETRDLVEISRSRHVTELPPAAWLVNGGRARPVAEPEAPVAIAESPAPSLSSRGQPRPAADQAPNPRPQTAVGAESQRATVGSSVTPATSGAAASGAVASGDLSSIVLQHQRLMARFLETQQTIMKAYLEGSPEVARAVPHAAASEVHQTLQQGLPADLGATDLEPRSSEAPASAPSMAEAAMEVPSAATAAPALPRLSPEEITEVLVSVVSERTGYPAQMLSLDDNITSDLGIDSIKWVEILGAYQEALPAALREGLQTNMEALVSAKTLAEISRLTAEIAAGLEPTASAAPAAAAAGESAAALPGPEEIIEVLVSVVSERTGYPAQMLSLDDNITSDLGIDSIKWVEILGAYQEALPAALREGLQTNMEALVSAKTLAEISRLTAEIAAGLEPTASAAPADVKPQPEGNAGPAEKSTGQTEDVPRFVVNATAAPLNEPATELFNSSKVLLVFDDEGGFGNSVCDRLGERGQRWVRVRRHANVKRHDDRLWGVDLADGGQIHELVESIRAEHGPLAGVLFLSPLEAATAAEIELDPAAWKRRIDREVKALFRVAQAVAPDLAEVGEGESACLLAATAMGGRFGIDPQSAGPVFPGQAGIAGLVKTLALEWPAVRCKAIDLDLTQPVEERALAVLAELDGSDSEIEVGYAANRRWVLRPRLSVSPPDATPIAPLRAESVVLVTGGARGITAQIALELAARYRPTLALLGRSPEPPETESPETAGIEAEGELKQILFARLQQAGGEVSPVDLERAFGRLVAEREIRRNLVDLRALAAEVVYLEADVLDEDSVANACATLRDRFGRIDAVIHGAGIIEDRLLVDKDPESFDRVFDTKVTGLLHLHHALRSDSLELVVLFASVAGRFGNRGQCDYAAANEVMNRLAAQLDRELAARVISINWGPWGQTGMASSEVQRRFAERGVQLIGPEGGRAAFAEMLETGAREEVEVILGDGPWRPAVAVDDRSREAELPLVTQAGVRNNGHTEWNCILDPSQDLYLDDHHLDGNPVLPAAVALEYIVEVVQKEWPGWHVVAVRDFQVLSGVVLENGPKQIRLVTQPVEVGSQNTSQVEVNVKLLDGDTGRQCYGARVDLSTSRTAIPDAATEPLSNLQAFPMSVEDAYERWLFHGPVFQTIEEIQGVTENVIVGVLKPSSPQSCLARATSGKWLIDPVIVDGAFQLTLLFARLQTDMTPLPARFGTLRMYSELNGSDVRCVIRARFSAGGQQLKTHTTFLSPSGEVIGVLEDAEFTASPALNRLGGQWWESLSV